MAVGFEPGLSQDICHACRRTVRDHKKREMKNMNGGKESKTLKKETGLGLRALAEEAVLGRRMGSSDVEVKRDCQLEGGFSRRVGAMRKQNS